MTWADLVSLRTTGPGFKYVFSRPLKEWSRLGPEQKGWFRSTKTLLVAKRRKFCNDSWVRGKELTPEKCSPNIHLHGLMFFLLSSSGVQGPLLAAHTMPLACLFSTGTRLGCAWVLGKSNISGSGMEAWSIVPLITFRKGFEMGEIK